MFSLPGSQLSYDEVCTYNQYFVVIYRATTAIYILRRKIVGNEQFIEVFRTRRLRLYIFLDITKIHLLNLDFAIKIIFPH